MRTLAALVVAVSALVGATSALAEERILDFDSRIAILRNGSIEVSEAIRVNVEHVSINHGIYRDLPTRYDLPRGGRMKVGFTFLDAQLDGAAVPAAVERLGNGVRMKLGSADSDVPLGEHVYRLRYRVTRELGFFSDYDELYWNVTGNGWAFPIHRATATVTLPAPISFGRHAVYTGAQGSTAAQAEVIENAPGLIRFATTAPLAPYDGLTIAAAFPKGVVDAPTANQKFGWALLDWLPMAVALASLLGLGFYLFWLWSKVGRDPPDGTTVPLFAPPAGLGPAAMRYVRKQGLDNRAFAAALVDAGVNGHVRLIEEKGFLGFGGDRFIEGLVAPPGSSLDPAELSAVTHLVKPGERLEFDNRNHGVFSASKAILANACKERFEGKAFKRNYEYAVSALFVWVGLAYATALAVAIAEGEAVRPAIVLPLAGVVAGWAVWRFAGKDIAGPIGCVTKMLAFAILFVSGGAALAVFPAALASGRWAPLLIILLGLPLALSSFAWISAPTVEGRALLDRIAGFKLYLGTTERERFDRLQAPDETLTLFERYLPYAIALGVENRWADRFSAQLAAAAAAASSGQSGFGWYSGGSSPWTDPGGFVSSIGSSLSSTISSASTAPGSSGGSGGGGSSGGGGGGGGGGGW